jgi:hypothetical protein
MRGGWNNARLRNVARAALPDQRRHGQRRTHTLDETATPDTRRILIFHCLLSLDNP